MVRQKPKLKAAQQAENIADIKVGAFATLATPFVFSTVWQGSEDRTLDPKRTSIETTLGATAGAAATSGWTGVICSGVSTSGGKETPTPVSDGMKSGGGSLGSRYGAGTELFFSSKYLTDRLGGKEAWRPTNFS